MEYSEAINHLFSSGFRRDKRSSLKSVLQLSQLCDHPHTSFPTVHVAGTNGKGSACYQIAHCLELAGYKVGLFTSPHIDSVCERVQINRELIREQDFLRYLKHLFSLVEKHMIDASFFDIITLLAFIFFKEQAVDIAIIETGLGGRLDATNILKPLVSVITSIGLDHTAILGNSYDQIAFEKAGIIKEGIPVIVGPSAHLGPIIEKAYSSKSQLESVEKDQIAAAVIAKLNTQGFEINAGDIKEGLLRCVPFRFEKVGCCILDGAHNKDSLEDLFKRVGKAHVIIALSQDRGDEVIELILAKSLSCHIWPHNHERLMSPDELAARCRRFSTAVFTYLNQAGCVQGAYEKSQGRAVLATGSFYILGDVKKQIKLAEPLLH